MAHARKRFGQHFLHDPAVIGRIVGAIAPRPGDHLVEIGPGRGALTRRLLASAELATLDAVEIDRDLAAQLAVELSADPRFHLHRLDALSLDVGALAALRGGKLRIAGNLPYNVSTPLLFHLLASLTSVEDMLFMLQREVVARMAAQPGTRDYGRLTVMLTPHVSVERLFDVGPGAFQPPPKVWSSVVRLRVLETPPFPLSAAYAEIVTAAFAQRRKTLRNALRKQLSPAQIEACGIDPRTRPEQLSAGAFNALASAFEERSPMPASSTMG